MDFSHDMITHGVNIVCAHHHGQRRGLAVAWATQVGKERVLICVGQQSATRELILASGAFGLSVLAAHQVNVARHFGRQSSRKVDKLAGLATHTAETGAPLLDDCLLCLDCRVEAVHDLDREKLIVGRVVAVERRQESCEPLIYREADY